MLLFSDLHLSPSTFTCCMKVLRRVHAEAVQRDVSVAFLGDFFDHVYNKGTLPVDILNDLMRFFADEWKVPMIMIPGNHDYFDASETEHGLTPFKYASKYITVLDEPLVHDNILWIPWRRDLKVLKDVLDTQTANVLAIFGHFDIVGFKLNASRISTEGLDSDIFPKDIPVYSGHYHTPQSHANIMYLGSPYQLSLSEAEDKKALVVLDSSCRVCETIPIDIGKHQYKWTPAQFVEKRHVLRPHDRVAICGEIQDSETKILINQMKENGVDIQVKQLISDSIHTRISDQEKLCGVELLEEYGKRINTDVNCWAWKTMVKWVREHQDSFPMKHANYVEPVRMEISGFGPFVGPVHLSLKGNGFTLISGECGPNASNGAGKSMATAGAWLWACTGMIDDRGSLTFTDGGVVRSDSEHAKVCVHGLTDGKPWTIIRQLSKKHVLKFSIDNVDRTRSTISATQLAIATEIFGLEMKASQLHAWLLRNCIWSQTSVSRWLDASDTQAKQEITQISNMEIWTQLASYNKNMIKKAKEKVIKSEMDYNSSVLLLKAASEHCKRQQEKSATWSAEHANSIVMSLETLQRARSTLASMPNPIDIIVEGEDKLAIAMSKLEKTRNDLSMCLANKIMYSTKLKKVPSDIDPLEPESLEQSTTKRQQTLSELEARKSQLQTKRNEIKMLTKNHNCQTCQRPFDNQQNYQQHLRSITDSIEGARIAVLKANESYIKANEHALRVGNLWSAFNLAQEYKQNKQKMNEYELQIRQLSVEFEHLSSETASMQTHIQGMLRKKAVEVKLVEQRRSQEQNLQLMERNHASILDQSNPYDTTNIEVTRLTGETQTINENLLDNINKLSSYTKMSVWVGSKGIQTYAMEYTLQKLTAQTNVWLRRIFNSEDIELIVSFDEKERLTRHIHNKKNKGVMSGGQWRRAQIASFMAWRDIHRSFPLLVMDEPCTSMDACGIQSVQKALRDWCDDDPQRTCFFITHEPEQHRDTSVYNNHIHIVHKRGRSSISENESNKKQKI
jgi:DNA repair exonuclease SbcCD nuclease subunit